MGNKKFNIMLPFDYVYYSIARQYYIWYDEEINEFSGIIILSLAQQFNIYTVLSLFGINPLDFEINPLDFKYNNPIYSLLVLAAILYTFNGIRYKKIITYSELHKRWGEDEKKPRLIKKSLVLVYLLGSEVLSLILMIRVS